MQYIAHEKRFVGALTVRISLAMQKLAGLEQTLAAARAELLPPPGAKVIEKLREKQLARWRMEQERKEAAVTDEIGTQLGGAQQRAGETPIRLCGKGTDDEENRFAYIDNLYHQCPDAGRPCGLFVGHQDGSTSPRPRQSRTCSANRAHPMGFARKAVRNHGPRHSAATQTQPATASAPAVAGRPGQCGARTAQERIDYLQKVLEEERLRLESEAQKTASAAGIARSKQNQLDMDRRSLADQKKAYEQTLAGATTQSDAAGFQKSMALFDELKPKQVKDLLMVMPADQVARYIAAMEPDRAAKIIAEFKIRRGKDDPQPGPGQGARRVPRFWHGRCIQPAAASPPVAAAAAGKAGP